LPEQIAIRTIVIGGPAPVISLGEGIIGAQLAGRAGVDLSAWRIDVIAPFEENPEAIWNSLSLPDSTYLHEGGSRPDQLIDGWSFLVWGDDTSDMANLFDFLYPNSSSYQSLMPEGSGGLRLVRSNGAYEQRLVYGTDASVLSTLEALGYRHTDANKGVLFGARAAPLALVGTGTSSSDFTWMELASGMYSPGAVNPSQSLPAQLVRYAIVSVIGEHGQQAGPDGTPLSAPLAMISIVAGASTSIVYTAQEWFRIDSLSTNGQSVAAAVGRKASTVDCRRVTGNITNRVSFDYAQPTALSFPTNIPTRWVSDFGHSEATPFAGEAGSLSTKYLLNMNPYSNEQVRFAITEASIHGTQACMRLQLLVDNAPHPTVNGRVVLYGGDSLNTNAWRAIGGIAIKGTNAFDAAGECTYTFALTNGTPGFMHARIEP